MLAALDIRRLAFFTGFAMVLLSVVLSGAYPNDPAAPPMDIPEPGALALMGVGGAAVMLASLLRRKRK